MSKIKLPALNRQFIFCCFAVTQAGGGVVAIHLFSEILKGVGRKLKGSGKHRFTCRYLSKSAS
jgi:hypothetical protein